MAVRRKGGVLKPPSNNGTSSSSSSSDASETRSFKLKSMWKTLVGGLCLGIAVYVGSLGYLETRVNTPFDDEKVGCSLCSKKHGFGKKNGVCFVGTPG